MKKIISFIFIMLVFVSFACADFRSVMIAANRMYKIGDYSAALELYKEAYELNPNQKLGVFIKKLQARVEATTYKVVDPKENWAKQQNLIYINAVSLLFNQVTISYKRAIFPNFGLGVSFLYSWNSGSTILTMPLFTSDLYFSSTPSSSISYGGGMTFDFYMENKAPNGLFGGIDINAAYTKYSFNPDSYYIIMNNGESYSFNLNLHVGYRWIFDWGGSIELQAGWAVAYLTMPYMPYLGGNNLNVGWAF